MELRERWMLQGDAPRDKPLEQQMRALSASYGKSGWGHGLAMGLGKTSVALNEFCMYVEDYGLTRMVVIAPNSFKPDWENEARTFRFPYPVHTFESTKRKAAMSFVEKHKDSPFAIVLNYEALRSDETLNFIISVIKSGPTYLAFDESIKLKGLNDTQKSALMVSGTALANEGFVRLLSGKPITQGPQDMWGQIRAMGGIAGKNYYAWRNRFCQMGGWRGKQIVGSQNEEELNTLINRWWHFEAADYSNRPEPVYSPRRFSMSASQERRYDDMLSEFMIELGEDCVASAPIVITRLLKLQQITSGFAIDDDGMPHNIVDPSQNPKIQAIKNLLEEEIEGKLIVGCVHRHSVSMLLQELDEFNPTYIRGSMPAEDLAAHKRKFNEDDTCRVIVCQMEATKYGHTLLGSRKMPCYNTVFFENSFSLDTRSQFEKRNDRTGQFMGVVYTDLICSSIDEKCVAALIRKEDVASAVLGFARDKGILKGVAA